jgi:hypothetical protein
MVSKDYSKRLEERAIRAYLNNRSDVFEFLENRSIRNILHFTHTLNLISILTNGLKSLESLEAAGIKNKLHDMRRSDEIRQGIFCSIAYPNIWMLNGKQNINPQEYAILEIMENALFLQHFAAFPGNSARNILKNHAEENFDKYVNVEGLKRMFLNKDLRNKQRIPKNEPTDLQAEIIFFNELNPDRIRKIHFPGLRVENFRHIYEILENNYPNITIEFQCSHNFFYRKNLQQGHDGRRFSLDWK